MPDLGNQLTLANLVFLLVAGGTTVLWALTRHAFRNLERQSRDTAHQLAELLPRIVLAEQRNEAIDKTVQAFKTTVCALESEQHQGALALTKLDRLPELCNDIREMRQTQTEQGAQLARIEGRLKRSASGQHPAGR